jgi:hemoglobin
MNDEMMVMADLRREGIAALVAAFYRRVKEDDLVGPMYPPEDWEGSEARLRDFLLFRIGGDPTYINERGHPRLRMRHQPFRIDIAARDRWLKLMGEAMDECAVPATSRPFLNEFFSQIADFMRNVEG